MTETIEKKEFMYEGKAKQIYATNDPTKVIIHYKDDATAYNAQKKGQIKDKGVMNNEITTILFQKLAAKGIKNHFVEKLDDRSQLCEKVSIVPLEFIVRNVIAGSMAKRLDIEEGTIPPNRIMDICYKRDDLGDPLINDDHAVALGAATYDELKEMYAMTAKVNDLLKEEFDRHGITLVDFKIEFGKDANGKILLADEISPDTCRLWDKETGKKLDKDRFRRDLGSVEEAYMEILKRIS